MFPESNSDKIFNRLQWLMEFEAKRNDNRRNNLSLVCEGLIIKKRNSNEMWGTADGKAACIYFDDEIANYVKNSLDSPDDWEVVHIGVIREMEQ